MSSKSTKYKGFVKAATAVAVLLVSQQTFAAAFASKEQSVTYLGNAFAGTASSSIDASSNWYNPAGLTQLCRPEVVVAGTYIKAQGKLENGAATYLGAPVTGQNPTYAYTSAFVPGFHASYPINRKLSVGFSVTAPFGLITNYNGNSIARFYATKSSVKTIDFTPSIAYAFNKQWAVGVGFDPLYVKAKLDVDTQLGAPGYLDNEADGWGYGFHAGVLFVPTHSTKMGLTYFSRITPHVKGTVQSLNIPGAARTSVTSKVNLPDRLVYSITQDFSDKWSLMGDIEFTHWNVFEKLTLDYNTGASATENFYYRNAWRFSLGTDYRFNNCWTFKGGLSYEETPVTDEYRAARLPDGDRYWVALGVKYSWNKNFAVDVAYSHLFFKDAPVNRTETVSAPLTRTLSGTYKSYANLIGAQVTWKFM